MVLNPPSGVDGGCTVRVLRLSLPEFRYRAHRSANPNGPTTAVQQDVLEPSIRTYTVVSTSKRWYPQQGGHADNARERCGVALGGRGGLWF